MYFHETFGVIGIALSLLRYGTYLYAIYQGTTKPHAFSWLGATAMAGVTAVLQWQDHAGPSLWVTSLVTLFCALIGVIAIFRGEKQWTKSDWASFIGMLLLIPIWLLTGSPWLALILILVIEVLNYYPTVRKSWTKPYDEDAFSWFLSALRWFCASLAVNGFSMLSLIYPAFVSTFEFGFVIYLLIRRGRLKKVVSA